MLNGFQPGAQSNTQIANGHSSTQSPSGGLSKASKHARSPSRNPPPIPTARDFTLNNAPDTATNNQQPVKSPASLSPPVNSPTQKEASRRRSFGFLSSSRKTSYSKDGQLSIPEVATPPSDTNSPLTPSLTQDSDAKSNPTLDSPDLVQPNKASAWYRGKRYTTDDLWQAVVGNELAKITKHLKAGLSVNYCQWHLDGIASLVDRAVGGKDNETLALLLRWKPDLTGSVKARYIQDQKRQHGEKWYSHWSSRKFEKGEPNDWAAPLHLAAKLGQLDAMRLLLRDEKADPNVMDSKGRTPLFHAVTSGDAKALDMLLDHGAQIEWTNQMNVTPLHASVIRGDLDMLKAIVKRGALLDKFDTYGETALYDAVVRGSSAIVRYLAEAGADLDIKNDAGISAYFKAASDFDGKMMKILADCGADIDVRDRNGCSALMRAIAAGNTQLVVALLENGVNIDATDNDGWTALDIAMMKKDETLVTLLVLNGVNLHGKDAQGYTVLHRAAARGAATLIRHLLVVKDQDPDFLHQSTGETPLHLAAAQGSRPAVRLLLQYGADLNKQNHNGHKPLHHAIIGGSLATVRELCNHPGVHQEDLSNTVSLCFATLEDVPDDTNLYAQRKAIVRFLQSKGLDVHWPVPPTSPTSASRSHSILIPTPTNPPPSLSIGSDNTVGPSGGIITNTVTPKIQPYSWADEPALLCKKRGLSAKPTNQTSKSKLKAKPASEVQVSASGNVIQSPAATAASVPATNGLDASSSSTPATTSTSSTVASAAVSAYSSSVTPKPTTSTATASAKKNLEEEKEAIDPFEASIPKPSPEKMERIIERYILERGGHGGSGGAHALKAGLEGVNAGLQIANTLMSII